MEPLKNAASKIFVSPIKVLASERSQPLNKAISGVAVTAFTLLSGGVYGVYAVNFYKKRKIQQKGTPDGAQPIPKKVFNKIDQKNINLAKNLVKNSDFNYFRMQEQNLMNAVDQKDVNKAREALKILAKSDLKIDTMESNGGAPLFAAVARSGNPEMAELFLEHGADPNQKIGIFTLMADAIVRGDLKMVELLNKKGGNIGDTELGLLLHFAADAKVQRPDAQYREIIDLLFSEKKVDLQKRMSTYMYLIKELSKTNPQAEIIYEALKENRAK